ncbi:MAG TPA: GAF domain-containing protein [Flavobacteriales bacterium]|nr:GAF domain-containing protein [Flavobacteriales bacterium]
MPELLSSIRHKLESCLNKALELEHADMGLIRAFDFSSNKLVVVMEKGFEKGVPEPFREATPFDSSACGRAAGLCKTVVIADVMQDIGLMPYRDVLLHAGLRSIKSVPLIHIDGTLRGILCMICRQQRWGWENVIPVDLLGQITACIV